LPTTSRDCMGAYVFAALQAQPMMPRVHVKQRRPVIIRTVIRNNARKKRPQEIAQESLAARAPKSTPPENRAKPCEHFSTLSKNKGHSSQLRNAPGWARGLASACRQPISLLPARFESSKAQHSTSGRRCSRGTTGSRGRGIRRHAGNKVDVDLDLLVILDV